VKTLRDIIKEEATIKVECLPEEMSLRGNCMASGDAEFDKQCEDKIIQDYENGNDWAWCIAKVTTNWEGLEATEYLGGCSYKSEQDFINDGYYTDMINSCLEELTKRATIISMKGAL